jgi:CRP/FNR family cyclic AMP-dependent transcriptional regulator
MENQELNALFQQNPWFQSLEPHHLNKLIEIAALLQWSEGEILFTEGDDVDHLYLLVEGRIAIEIYIPDKGRRTILTVGPNDVFGWSSVTPFLRTRTASARASMPSKAVAFDSQALIQACEEDHDLGFHVYRRLSNIIAGRLSATRLQLIDMYAQAKK